MGQSPAEIPAAFPEPRLLTNNRLVLHARALLEIGSDANAADRLQAGRLIVFTRIESCHWTRSGTVLDTMEEGVGRDLTNLVRTDYLKVLMEPIVAGHHAGISTGSWDVPCR